MNPQEDLDRGPPQWMRRVVEESGETVDQPSTVSPAGASTVGEIMAQTTYCVTRDVGLDTLARILLEHRMSGVPVVDAVGRPIGVVSKTDLLRHLHERGDTVELRPIDADVDIGFHHLGMERTTVSEIMMPVVFALSHDVPITQAAALMASEGVHRLPIVGATGTVVGILSALDIVRWVAEQAGHRV